MLVADIAIGETPNLLSDNAFSHSNQSFLRLD